MLKYINEVIEAAEYLKDTDSVNQLKRMERSLEEKNYLLAFMGQFSAGKSKLINNLVGKTILPVHITETTALITFVKYSENECANIFYEDESFESVPIEKTFDIWQSGEKNAIIDNINHIEICVNCDLLKNGLIIADTPGINTIVEKHVKIATNLISNSDRIVYVLGKSLTSADESFVKSIIAAGIKVMFVRTHMDELKTDEENYEQTILSEKNSLTRLTDDNVFFVSNENGKPFNENINELRTYLSVNLANKIDAVLQNDTSERIEFLSEKLLKNLSERRLSINQLLQNEKNDFIEHKNSIEKELSRLEDILKRNKDGFSKKYEKTKEEAKEVLDRIKSTNINSVQNNINSFNFGESIESYSQKVNKLIRKTCINIKKQYIQEFDNLIAENKELIMEEADKFVGFNEVVDMIPDNLEDAESNFNELADKISSLNVLKEQIGSRINEIKEQSVKNNNEKEKLNAEEAALEETAAVIKRELDSYPEYVPQYIIKAGNHSNEKRWGAVGKILDIATILIPGKVWANIGAKAASTGAKILNSVNKGAKLGAAASVAAKLGETADVFKAVNNIDKVDKIADAARVGGRLVNSSRKSKKEYANKLKDTANDVMNNASSFNEIKNSIRNEQPSIFDYFSIDYYFKKIGRKFDTPDVKVLDKDYEEKYNAGKKEIMLRLKEQYDLKLERRLKLIDMEKEDQVLQAKREYEAKKQEAIDANIKELEEKLQRERINSKNNKIRTFYASLAEEKISDYCVYLLNEVQPLIDKQVSGYLNTYDLGIVKELDRQKAELSSLEDKYNSSDISALIDELKLCQKYIKFLKDNTMVSEA